MERVALLNGKNINQDYDLMKMFKSLSTDGVVEGLQVQAGKVTPGYAFINITRGTEIFPVLFQNTADVVIDTTGTTKIYIEITQTNIDDGTNNNADGTGIGSIKTGASYPAKNYIPLATINTGTITDDRVFISLKKELENRSSFNASSNGTDDYTITIPGLTSYQDGIPLRVKADVANIGPCTVNVNNLGAIPVKKQQGTVDLEDGDWSSGGIAIIVYNSTLNVFQYSGQDAIITSGLGYTAENIVNKSTNTSLGTSNILYPTQNAVTKYLEDRNPNIIASDVLRLNLGNQVGDTSGNIVKKKEAIIGRSGTVRVYFGALLSNSGGWIRIYKNGVPVGIQRSPVSGVWTYYTEDIPNIVKGDLLQVYVKSAWTGQYAYIVACSYKWSIDNSALSDGTIILN